MCVFYLLKFTFGYIYTYTYVHKLYTSNEKTPQQGRKNPLLVDFGTLSVCKAKLPSCSRWPLI